MRLLRLLWTLSLIPLALTWNGCGGGSKPSAPVIPDPVQHAVVAVTGPSGTIATNGSATFTASVTNTSNTGVTWSIDEAGGGSIDSQGRYTAPALPGIYTVRATLVADTKVSASAAASVIIPVGHVANYDVGVDYHATGSNFLTTTFINRYSDSAVRQTVRAQLQGMADRGATIIFHRIWLVTEPGTTDFGETWRSGFPLSDQEAANLHQFAMDVAAVRGSGGNRLRLNICLLWLGAADYTRGDPVNGLGFTPVSASEYTRRVEVTTDKVLASIKGVNRPDGIPVADLIYFNGEAMVGGRPNEDWLMKAHYPRFVDAVKAAGFQPSIYFIVNGTVDELLQTGYVDGEYPILNDHRSMYWVYRTIRFMVDNNMYVPPRIDISFYISTLPAPYGTVLVRMLNDADVTLPSLGANQSYGLAETFYFTDPTERKSEGQSIAAEAAQNGRLHMVCFWTTPWGGDGTTGNAYPFAIEDFFPPPAN